ncbi:MAG: TonB-dependent receptor [Prevotella sp.]|nr:TonB-dependent receptor [Prevotella sp.]
MNIKKQILTALMLLVITIAAQAQTINVKGNVVDETGEPMIGATVKPVGGQGGTITDIDGNYSLDVPKSIKELEFSYIGYRNQKVTIKNGVANVQMRSDANQLEDLVVIGYGAVKKGDITNAVAKVKGEDLAERPVSNIATALQGELAGVDIQNTSGAPGSSVQVKVRGATSINEDGNSNPLYVVDGVPMDEDFDLMQINPHDIESIEVLKDASSSAIYGSRGANGVVIVTCKKGNDDGKTTVTASVNFSMSTPERYVPIMSGSDWINWRTRANYQNYIDGNGNKGAQIGDSYVEQVLTMGGVSSSYLVDPRWKMDGYGGLSLVDWQKAMFRPSYTRNYNLSISQGTKKNSYRASLSYVNQDGIVIHTGFKRLTAKLSGFTTLFDKVKIGIDVSPQMIVTTGGNVDGKDGTAKDAMSLVPVVENQAGLHTAAEPYSRYIFAGSTASPVAVMEQRTYRDEQIRIQSSAYADYTILKGLNAKVLGSWIFNNRDRKNFMPSSVHRSWASGEGYETTSTWTGSRSHKYHLEATVTYDHTWEGVHHLNTVGGWSVESTQDASQYAFGGTHFPGNTIQGWTINDVTPTSFTATYTTDDHLVSYFARAEYGYDSRYLLNASIRRDGSSRFGYDRKWGTFPAISAAWRASNESFWDRHWWVNQAKLRISYGSNGSNAIPLNAADGLMTASYYSSEDNASVGYIPASASNPDLGWQKTNSWNFGADISLFNNRISFAVDYYIKNIQDMLYQVQMPLVIGYAKAWNNIGNIRTKGLELELKTENLVGKLKWTTKIAAGYSTNKVKSLGSNQAIYTGYDNMTQIIEVGRPVGEYYLYIADGVYMNEEDLLKYPTQSTSTVGSVRYRDINGDGIIDENDRTYCGKPQPSWTFGITNTFKWKEWDASFLITAQTGGRIWQGLARAFDMQSQGIAINRLDRWQDMWLSEDQPGDGVVPRAQNGAAEEYSTRWLYSTDFIKLKNISIGYRWRLPKKFALKMLRFTASVENVFMITAYKNGFSPESNNSSSAVSVYDYGAYPQARTFSIGVNATF